MSLTDLTLKMLITDVWFLPSVNCNNCGHVYVAHKLGKTKDRKNFLFNIGKCLIMGCNCASYADKIEQIDEELL